MTTERLISAILCTGCSACFDSCPTGAIEIIEDEFGFLAPIINTSKCIDCNKCIDTCPCRKIIEHKEPICAYTAYCLDETLYNNSSSGGIFAIIAYYFILQGGIVYGAAYDSASKTVKHVKIDSLNDIRKIQGSKYVQSETRGIYRNVKEAIKEGRKVLFSGTPCQIAALYSSVDLNSKRNLYTIELICHGVSNNRMLKKSILAYNTREYPTDIRFRNKTEYEKSAFSLMITYRDGLVKTIDSLHDLYYRLYIDGRNYRGSCYECKYSCRQRIADMTLGDCSIKTIKGYQRTSHYLV